MSQNDAKSSELSKVVKKFKSNKERESQGLGTEIEVKARSNVKIGQDDGVADNSELGGNVANVDADGDEANHESGRIIQFLFGPQVNLNVYVVSEIAKYLDFQDLKSLRQVDKLWSAGVTPAFLRKSVVVLKPGKRSENELQAFEAETKNLKGLSSLKIEIDEEFGFYLEPLLFIGILTKLSPSLKALELEFGSQPFMRFPSALQFPALSSLTIGEYDAHPKNPERHFFQFIYASAPNLTELAVCSLNPYILSPLLAPDGSRASSLAPKLKSLRVFDLLSSAQFKTLVNFPQTWERLEFCALGQNLKTLSRLLDNNKDSLLSLKLEVDMEQGLKLPKAFSKLQKLELYCAVEDFWRSEIKYSKTFPALSSLSLDLDIDDSDSCFEMMSGIWKSLFPPQVFKELKRFVLDLPCSKENYAEFLRREGIAENWAQSMFPNARIEIN